MDTRAGSRGCDGPHRNREASDAAATCHHTHIPCHPGRKAPALHIGQVILAPRRSREAAPLTERPAPTSYHEHWHGTRHSDRRLLPSALELRVPAPPAASLEAGGRPTG